MQFRIPASVGVRAAFAFLILGTVALGGAVTTWLAMEAQAKRIAELTRASTGPTLVESMRAGVYAVVMESRGLYLPNPPQDALAFANGLRRQLASVQADWRALREVLPEQDLAAATTMEGALRDFVALRTELARVGVEEGAKAADKIGNNDANRSTRKKFSDGLDTLAKTTALHVAYLNAESIAAGRRLSLLLLATTSVAVALALLLGLWLLRRTVSLPLRHVTSGLARMADGQLDNLTLPPAGDGEVGAIAAAAGVFLTKLRQNRELEASAESERATAQRRQVAMDRHTHDFGTSIAGVMASLVQSAATMHQSASEMLEAARRTSDSASSTVEGTTASARDLNAVAVAAEEMAASIGEISEQVARVTTAVGIAVERTSVTNSKVSGLAAAAERIGDVVRLIADIAGQTNLLALNATIEAARAGEAGKGFAVVAGEVKALANQTAHATEQIGKQVEAIRDATGEAVSSVRDVGGAIGQVEEVANAIAAAVEEQAMATREISATVQTVTVNTGTAMQAMRGVLEIAERTNAAGQAVVAEADEVGRTADTLRTEVNEFLAAMSWDGAGDRRGYERVSGGGARATVRIGDQKFGAEIQNISRGGVALSCAATETSGTEVLVSLPGNSGVPMGGAIGGVRARVVHAGNGALALAFRQDPETLTKVKRAIDEVQRMNVSEAA